MRKKRMTETTLETKQAMVFIRPHSSALVLCEQCACGMLMLDEAVAISQVSSRQIYHWVDSGLIHFTETPEGMLLLCLKSLVDVVSDQ